MPRKSETSKNLIYQELRRSIILGEIKPGEKVNLETLAKKHDTSVTPVREALQMLAQEELITAKPHLGYFVSQVTLKELTDLLDLREVLELAAVVKAAPKITDQQIALLERVHLGKTERGRGRYESAVIENREFHYQIALASGNHELADALGHVHDRLARFFVFVHSPQEVQKRHKLVIEALKSHDVGLARDTLLKELNETKEYTLEHVIEKDGTTWYLGTNQEPDLE